MNNLLNPATPVEINSLRLLLCVLLVHLVGPQAMIVQPAFVDGMVHQLGFSLSQANYVAGLENAGKAVQSLLMMLLIATVNWRYLCYAALGVLIAGNLACTMVDSYDAFRVLRFFTGMATGTIVPLSYVIIGLTAAADRNFALILMSLMVYAAVVFYALPSVFEALGFTGLVLFFAAFASLGLFVVRNLPSSGKARQEASREAVHLPWRFRGMALVTMFVYFVATFGVWANLTLIGKDGGLSDEEANNALALSQFFGIGGALAAMLLGSRFGRAWPLALGLGSSAGALLLLNSFQAMTGFLAGVCLFNLLWNFSHPYLLGAQASFDSSGRQVSYATAMQMCGIAAGPTVAGWLLEDGSYADVILLSTVLMVLSLILIQAPVLKAARAKGRGSRNQQRPETESESDVTFALTATMDADSSENA